MKIYVLCRRNGGFKLVPMTKYFLEQKSLRRYIQINNLKENRDYNIGSLETVDNYKNIY